MAKRRTIARSKIFSFRLTEAEKQSIELTAIDKGISIGKLIRTKLRLQE
jgi:hypothetical protein